MQYTKPKFSVAMPGADVDWPFDDRDETQGLTYWYEQCRACGAQVAVCGDGFFPAHEHADDAGRPRRRVCFGR